MEDLSLHAQRRAAGYWNIDGLPELYIGFVWLCVPLYTYGTTHVPKTSPWFRALVLGGIVGLMGAIFASRWLVDAVKSRVTYPRTGYVACQKPKSKPYWFALLLAAMLLAVVFGPPLTVLPGTGLVFAAIAGAVASATGSKRIYTFAGLMLLLGIALGLTGADVNTGMSLLFGAAGAFMMLSGGWTLWHYLEHA